MTRAELIQYITDNVYPNGRNEVTAPMVRDSLLEVVAFLGDAATYNIGMVASGNQGLVTGGNVRTAIDLSLAAYYTSQQTDQRIAQAINNIGLGQAAYKNIGQVAENNTDLVTGGQVYTAINTALTSAIKFQGISDTPLTDGSTTNPIQIDGQSYTAKKGDMVVYGGNEFLWVGNKWQQMGDESSYALKTITITGTGYLSGGGDLTQNRTLDISTTAKGYIDHGETAYNYFSNGVLDSSHLPNMYIGTTSVRFTAQAQNMTGISSIKATSVSESLFEWDSTNNAWHFHGNVYADGWLSGGGISSGSGGGGGIDPLAMWQILTNNPSLSSYDNYTKISADHITFPVTSVVGLTGGITAQQIATALNLGSFAYKNSLSTSDIPDLSGTYLPISAGSAKALTGTLYGNAGAVFYKASAGIVEVRRIDEGGGAFVDYFPNGQDTYMWRVGSSSDYKFVWEYGTANPVFRIETNGQLVSYASAGTAPFSINSTTVVSNLNADLLDGQHGSYYMPAAGITQAQSVLIKQTNDNEVLRLDNSIATTTWLLYYTQGTYRGEIGVNSSSNLVYRPSTSNDIYTVYHSGNSNISSVSWKSSAIWSGWYLSSYDISSRLTDFNFSTSYSSVGSGRTAMRIDLFTDSVNSAQWPSSAISGKTNNSGYVMSFGWDHGTVYAMSQLFIPNGDHITSTGGPQCIAVRGNDNGTWSSWRLLAYADGIGASGSWNINAATATKLETQRTIWGQNFDGTGNVDGSIYVTSTYPNVIQLVRNDGVGSGSYIDYCSNNQSANKWRVGGLVDSYANQFVFNCINGGTETTILLISGSGSVTTYGNFDATGVIHATTGIYTDGYLSGGGLSTTSDEREKKNWRKVNIGLKAILNAPAGAFDWINKPGSGAGTTAQYWQKFVPELVGEIDDVKNLQYGPLAYLCVHALAEHETEQDREIRKLRKRVAELEKRLNIS